MEVIFWKEGNIDGVEVEIQGRGLVYLRHGVSRSLESGADISGQLVADGAKSLTTSTTTIPLVYAYLSRDKKNLENVSQEYLTSTAALYPPRHSPTTRTRYYQ